MHPWKIIITEKSSASFIMERDAQLLENLEQTPILHFYEWAHDSATYGCFTKPEDYLNMQRASELKLDLAKRPTGGGIVFHICDFAFSLLLPANHPKFSINTLDNYALVNEAVIKTIQDLQEVQPILLPEEGIPLDFSCKAFCMAKPTKYDVMMQGRKVGGAAQRRTKKGLLHQGTICVATLPTSYLEDVLLPGSLVIEAMQKNSFSLLGPHWTKQELEEMRTAIQHILQKHIVSL